MVKRPHLRKPKCKLVRVGGNTEEEEEDVEEEDTEEENAKIANEKCVEEEKYHRRQSCVGLLHHGDAGEGDGVYPKREDIVR